MQVSVSVVDIGLYIMGFKLMICTLWIDTICILQCTQFAAVIGMVFVSYHLTSQIHSKIWASWDQMFTEIIRMVCHVMWEEKHKAPKVYRH